MPDMSASASLAMTHLVPLAKEVDENKVTPGVLGFIVFAAMASLAGTIKRDLSGMGKFLFIGVILLILASFANIFLQIPGLMIATSLIAIGIFSAFMVYDVQRILNGGETNYITATLAIYLDIYNVFTNLLALLGITGGSSD